MNKQNIRPIRRVLAAILSLALLLTFTPLSGVVTLSAGALDDSVTYIGANGTPQIITDYTSVGSYDGNIIRNWEAGNYVVSGNVAINVSGKAAVKLQGTVNLILCDGAHLTVNSTNSYAFTGIDEKLNIFTQSTGNSKGKLTATGDEGIRCGSLNVYGGEVTFKGTSHVLHFDGDDDSEGLTVNGGDVRIVNNTVDQAAIFDESSIGHVTVNSGTLTVSSSGGGKAIEYIDSIAFNDGTADITGNITDFSTLALNGGNVTIEGGLGGFYEDASKNKVILDYQRPTDKYKITNLNKLNDDYDYDYTVKVAENKAVSADGTSYTGTLTAAQRAAISGKDITPFFGTVTVADGITGGTVTASKTSDLFYGETVTLTVTPKTGYTGGTVTVRDSSNNVIEVNNNQFTMPASDVTVSATFTPDSAYFSQDGDTYTIHDATGWDIFCDCLQDNDTYNRFSGKTVELGDNITVSRMAGSSHHDFCGTFDGQGNTLTFNYNAEAEYAAPFRYVDTGCVIKNLHVNGTITTDKKYAAGIIAQQYGTVTIRNCRSSINIQSSVKGDGTHAGLVAVNNKSADLTIEGCVFDGKIDSTGTDDDATTSCGGFVGWRSGNAEIHNSIFDPAEVTIKKDDSATFARNKIDTYNSYYTYLLNDGTNYAPYLGDGSVTPKKYNNGQQAYTITAGDDVTLGLSGDATEYDVSGINVYSSGIEYNGNLYAGSGDTVALELNYTGTPAAGYTVKGYTASNVKANGTDLTADDNGVYTVTMPDSNVTVTADFTFSVGKGAVLVGHSISLVGDIGVNFYMELDDNIVNSETAKMRFTIPTGNGTTTQDVFVKDARVDTVGGKTYYIFKCQVAAKEMTSQITAQLLDGEYESDVFPYSVKEYADYLLAHTGDNDDYAKAAPLVKAMLNYGANSQLNFGKNTDTLANAGLTAEEKELGDVEITIADPVIGDLPEGTTFIGATLSLRSETTLSLYFKSSDHLTFSCGDYDVVPDSRGDYQIARIRGIKAAEIGNIFTLNVNGGTVSYSPLNYCKYVLADNTQNEKLQNAVKALVLYWQAAAAYFGAPAPEPAVGIFFTKVTDESDITRGNIGECTFAQAKAWAIANWDDIMNTEKDDVDIVFSDDNDIYYINIKKGVTAKQDIEGMSGPDSSMEIDAIKYYYTHLGEDVYLCGRFFKKVTDENRITEDNIGKCTFDEAKAWAIANWVDIMKTDLNSVHIVYINDDCICLISISEMTDITDFMEMDEPEAIGVDIDFIHDLFTNSREDVYLCSPAALP